MNRFFSYLFKKIKQKGNVNIMKKAKKHIIWDVITMWLLVFAGIYVSYKRAALLIVYIIPLAIWFACRTYRYFLILIDVLYSKPICVRTRGYRFAMSERIYALDITTKVHYYYVLFDDKNLNDGRFKDKYIFFEARPFRGGELLEITYYKKSKVILDIQKIDK